MGSKVEKHLSRLAMPATWHLKRKGRKFITRPLPGAHSLKLGMPLNLVLRDLLDYVKTSKEVRYVLNNQEIFVDGIRRKEQKFIVGLMDVVSVPLINAHFRVLLDKKNRISLFPISREESNSKLCRIKGKKMAKGSKVQLTMHDGKNILLDKCDYRVGDSLLIEIPSQKIKVHIHLRKGALVYLTGGKHVGEIGAVEEVKQDKVSYKQEKGTFETSKEYAFAVGEGKPAISLPK